MPAKRTIVASLAVAALVPASASAVVGTRNTQIASSPSADAASANPVFSSDSYTARYLAFDSEATNQVPGDANGIRDVFVGTRGAGLGNLSGATQRVSVGRGGAEANGPSQKASLDGQKGSAAHCATFESTATNLDSADRSPDSDVFVRDLRRNTTSLVSVGHSGAQNGSVDGECEFVTYDAGGSVFVRDLRARKTVKIARGTRGDQQTKGKGVAYERSGQVYYQPFQKVIVKGSGGRKKAVKRMGREILASAGARGAGNGASGDPSIDDNGFYVAFESTATNLCVSTCQGVSDDRNGPASDVFRRTLSKRAPTRDRMQMVSYSGLVDEQGNGASNNPAMTGAGENIVFDSEATNLRQSVGITSIDPNGSTRDIYYWNFPRERLKGAVSRESKAGPKGEFNGASYEPATSARANYIAFSSEQTGESGESNGGGIADLFLRFMGGSDEGGLE